jgi:hypothetical protein
MMTEPTTFFGIQMEYWQFLGILLTIVSPIVSLAANIYLRRRSQRAPASVRNANQNRITQTAMSTLLLLTRHPNLQQQRIHLSRCIEIVVISIQTFVFLYSVVLAIFLPGLLSNVSDQDIKTRLIILVVFLFVLVISSLLMSILTLIRLQRRITSRTAKHMTIIVNEDFVQLMRHCLSTLLNMGADLISFDLEGGLIEAELTTGRMNIRVSKIPGSTHHRVQIHSDTFLPSSFFDDGKNRRNLSAFTHKFFELLAE